MEAHFECDENDTRAGDAEAKTTNSYMEVTIPGPKPKQLKAHKKSRGGCVRCKQRKVKCNEARPVCNNCHRHGAACEYTTDPAPGRDVAESSMSATVADLSGQAHLLSPPVPAEAASTEDNIGSLIGSMSQRQLELRLMHHFVSVVGLTFPSSSLTLARGLWTVDAVRLAFQHDFLLNAIFAIAALHLIRGLPDSTRFLDDVQIGAASMTLPGIGLDILQLTKVHGFYLDLAAKQQTEALAAITPENANALVFASVLISYQGLKLLPRKPGETAQPYSPPVQWLRMVRGIFDVSGIAGRIGSPEPVIPYMLHVSGEPDFSDHEAFYDPANCEQFRYLLNFDEDMEAEDDAESRIAYEKAVAYIGRLAGAIESEAPPRVIFRFVLGFAILTPSRFITCVEAGRPRALAILAHYFALAKSVDDHWIFAGLADREVHGIRSRLPQSWQHFLDWPLRVLKSHVPTYEPDKMTI